MVTNNSFVLVAVLLFSVLAFGVTNLVVALMQKRNAYNATATHDWILLGGLTATSVEFRLRVFDSASGTILIAKDELLINPLSVEYVSVINYDIQAISLSGLESNTIYYYGVKTDTKIDIILRGRFRTPATIGTHWNFTVALGGCAWTGSTSSVFDDIASFKPDLFLHLGDLHYEDIDSNDMALRLDAVATVLGSEPQARLFRSTSLAYMWDDHDWLGNDSGDEEKKIGARNTALESYRIAFPHYPLASNAENPSPYHAFTLGTVRFIVSDLRSESSAESIYSDAQRVWLKEELAQAEHFDFVVWVTTKPWIGEVQVGEDSWLGQAKDRQELSDFISTTLGGPNGAQNLLAVSADAHMLAFDDGSNTYFGQNVKVNGTAFKSFPIVHSGPLDRLGSSKGGPFSNGCTSCKYSRNHHYTTFSFEFFENSDPCIQITAYNLKSQVYSRRLCGLFFQIPTNESQGSGSCSIDVFPVSTVVLFSVAIATVLATTVMACCFFKTTQACFLSFIAWFAMIFTLGIGIGTPLASGIRQFDTLPSTILTLSESIALALCVAHHLHKNKNNY